MAKLTLYHHVYTSISGYKTVYVSPELKPDVVRALEAFSDTLYPRVRQHTLRSLYHPSPDHICISRVFRSSADHAGRRRSCVHNILFSKSELLDLRYVNPFAFPESLFLKTAPEPAQVLSLKRTLPRHLDLGSPSPDDLKIDENILNAPVAQTIFSAVISNHDMAIIAPAFDCYSFLATAGDMLPPFLRLSTAVVAGTIYRSTYTDGATVYSLEPGFDIHALKNEGVITYDTTSGHTANLPAPNRYFAFVASNLTEDESPPEPDIPEAAPQGGPISTTLDLSSGILGPAPQAPSQLSGPEKVRRLVALVHRYPIARIASNDMYHNLVKAFKATSHCFKDDGSVDAMCDVNAILKYLLAFYQAGYTHIVLDTLRWAFGDLEAKGELTSSGDILKQLEASLEDSQVQPAQKEAAINRLASWLTRTYAKT